MYYRNFSCFCLDFFPWVSSVFASSCCPDHLHKLWSRRHLFERTNLRVLILWTKARGESNPGGTEPGPVGHPVLAGAAKRPFFAFQNVPAEVCTVQRMKPGGRSERGRNNRGTLRSAVELGQWARWDLKLAPLRKHLPAGALTTRWPLPQPCRVLGAESPVRTNRGSCP